MGGDTLLVHWVADGQAAEPQSANLSISKFTTEAAGPAESYQNMGELLAQLRGLFQPAAAPSGGAAREAGRTAAASQLGGRREEGRGEERPRHPEPLREGPSGATAGLGRASCATACLPAWLPASVFLCWEDLGAQARLVVAASGEAAARRSMDGMPCPAAMLLIRLCCNP